MLLPSVHPDTAHTPNHSISQLRVEIRSLRPLQSIAGPGRDLPPYSIRKKHKRSCRDRITQDSSRRQEVLVQTKVPLWPIPCYSYRRRPVAEQFPPDTRNLLHWKKPAKPVADRRCPPGYCKSGYRYPPLPGRSVLPNACHRTAASAARLFRKRQSPCHTPHGYKR